MNQSAIEEFLDIEIALVIERAKEEFGPSKSVDVLCRYLRMLATVELASKVGADRAVLEAAVKEPGEVMSNTPNVESMSTEQIRAMMDERYAVGDAYELRLPFDALRGTEIYCVVLDLVPPSLRHCRALDVGSSTAGIVRFWPHQDIVGVEISAEAVKAARAKFPNVDYRVASIEDWSPHPGEHFSLAVAVESIEHWQDAGRGLDAIHDAMSPEGMLVLTTPNRDSLHCRIGKKLGITVPKISYDHVHEFGYRELIECVEQHGFVCEESRGVHCAPYWALEEKLGIAVRELTDNDVEVNNWFNDVGRSMPAEYAFIQCHRFSWKGR
jgi:SAM-dependent methyltransferase